MYGQDGTYDTAPVWACSFTGYARLRAGAYSTPEYEGKNKDQLKTSIRTENIVFGIIYLTLVVYTVMFTFIYLRRVLWVAFLTMIAPLIAVTYPLDKLKDGKAQAFGLWIREYAFNVLIQPVHFILYIMVISNVMDYVEEHPIYALLAIGFLLPAENFMRKMFGFEKAGTLSTLGKAAGGAAVMGAVNSMSKLNHRRDSEDDEKGETTRTPDEEGTRLPRVAKYDDKPMPKEEENQAPSGANGGSGAGQGQNVNIRTANQNRTGANSGGSGTSGQRQSGASGGSGGVETINGGAGSNTQGAPSNVRQNAPQTKASSDEDERGILSRLSGGLLGVAGMARKKAIKAKPLRKLGKYTGKIFGGMMIGTAGLIAGLATGDERNVAAFTLGGFKVGESLGGTMAENAMDIGRENIHAFERGYEGEQAYNNRRADEAYWKKDEARKIINNDDIYPEMRGNIIKEARREHKIQREIQTYRNSGITDNKKITKAMKMKLSAEEGTYAIKLAEIVGEKGWNNPRVQASLRKQYTKALSKEKGLDQNQIEKIWDAVPKILFKL